MIKNIVTIFFGWILETFGTFVSQKKVVIFSLFLLLLYLAYPYCISLR
jgi:hypothetical protein